MKKLLFILLFVPLALFGQEVQINNDDPCLTQGPNFSIVTDSILCDGDTTLLLLDIISINSPFSLYWYPNGETYFNIEVSPDESTTYICKITDANNCVSTDTLTLEIINCLGCTDESAGNYNPEANIDDGSCISQEEYTIDSLNNVVEHATISVLYLQHALDTWNTTIDLSAGWNMFGYGCPSSIDMAVGLSNHTENIIITKDNSGNVYMPEFGFNGIGDFTPGFGYQIKLTQAIEGFSLCDWYVNDIPEDNIISLQDYIVQLEDSIELLNATYEVEDFAHGGLVFYVDSTGQHGLVAAMDDLEGTYEWGCSQQEVNGADGTSIGTGYQNTIDIVNQGCSTVNGSITAAQAAFDAEINGYSDWYLPSRNELIEMYNTIGNGGPEGNIGGFENNMYWSSTEFDINYKWSVYFDDGNTYLHGFYYTSSRVRPIRSF